LGCKLVVSEHIQKDQVFSDNFHVGLMP